MTLGDADFRKSPMKMIYRKFPKTASLPVTGHTGGRRPVMRLTTKRTRKTTNRIHAIWVAAPAMPLSPRIPAISPMTRKVMLQLSISSFSFFKDRTAKFRLKTYFFTLACDTGLRRPPYNARKREESTVS